MPLTTGATLQLPDPTVVKDSEKDEDYHRNYVLAITNRAINNGFDLSYATMTENLNYFDGVQTEEAFRFLTEAEDGEVLPAKWINYNAIRNKVEVLVGELANKGYEIEVKAVNKDAVARKLEERETLRVDYRLSPIATEIQNQTNLPMPGTMDEMPESEQEIDEFFEKHYKEKSEIVMERMLKYIDKRTNWEYQRIALFRDLIIHNRCFCKIEIVNGIPTPRRIDPRLVIFDTNAEDDLLTDSTFWGEVRYMDFADAAEMYGLTQKELRDAYSNFRSYEKASSTLIGSQAQLSYSALEGSKLRWFQKASGNSLRVLVVTAYWKDTKSFNYKESQDKYGNTHYKKVSDTYSPATKEKIIKKRISIWRTGTLIGGTIFKQWGEMENQVVSVDEYQITEPPYYGVIPNFVNYMGISIVQQLKGLQDLKNITMYNIQLAMARAGAKGFVYDVSQVPEGWDVHTVIKYLKTVGIAFIDSVKDGIPKQFNQFQQLDMTLSASVTQYLNVMFMIDDEMRKISGINEDREGQARPYTPVGVAQAALFQSSMMTATKFKEFNMFVNRVFTGLAGLGKICWADKDRFAPIIGDAGINFLNEDIDLSLNDYGVFIREIPPAVDDKQNFQAIVMAALQQGALEFVDAIKLLREDDISYGIRELERKLEQRQEQMQQMAMAQQQQQAQAQAQLQQMKQQGELEKIDRKGQWDLKEKGVDLKSDYLKQKMDFAKQFSIEKLKAAYNKRMKEATGLK